MKYKKIIDLCKKRGTIILCEGSGGQWITDGGALYPLTGLPYFDEDTICKSYDITPDQAEKIRFETRNELPSDIDVSDYVAGEVEAEKMSIQIVEHGVRLIPYMTSVGVQFIDRDYLTPFSDIKDDSVRLVERYTPSGMLYFAVKVGMLCAGVIMPYDVIEEGFVEKIDKLARLCRCALNGREKSI